MRIVIDLQAAQSTGSRSRGIGRYSLSLAQAMVRNRGEHEILIALNGLFPETIESIRASFADLLPQENIRVWHAVAPVSDLDSSNDGRRQAAEIVREAFLASLRPDIVHISSVFEGGDDAITSIGRFARLPTAVTLYDLIPFIYRHPYLDDPSAEAWYLRKLDYFRRADLWLSISESSRQEGLDYLNLPLEKVVNISTAADSHFQRMDLSAEVEHQVRHKYGLLRSFVMYTGGIDHRKNLEGLIRAFSLMPEKFRVEHQLAIVCSARPEDQQRLLNLAKKLGMAADNVILTGFVPENDLVALYNLCKLFVFPSWHEGFGLPALEAMHCGAPVIGANTSSLPEVIGWDEALFDPRSDDAISAAMERALGDEVFRAELLRHGKLQAAKFAWDASARTAIAAFESFHAESRDQKRVIQASFRKPKLAYVSPLPPTRSGIAYYSAELLPELARHYEIDLVVAQPEVNCSQINASWAVRSVEWFASHANEYERVLYHFGNSDFHSHMFDLLAVVPGVVVLHDFFLSGIVAHMDFHGLTSGGWVEELYRSHGYHAVQARFHASDIFDVVWKYPCNLSVLQNSLGIIAHSENLRRLVLQWYGSQDIDHCSVIPLMRQPAIKLDRSKVRARLGIKSGDFVVCSFGLMGPTKLNHRLLEAWLGSCLSENPNCHLVFVGENEPGAYGQVLVGAIRDSKAKGRIRITGWADMDTYREYLAVTDLSVQLRTISRGEASAAVLDCMNYGLATIVNANGSMADLPDNGVWKLSDEFTDEQLIEALETLWQSDSRRRELGENARNIILQDHSPEACAEMYVEAIERFYRSAAEGLPALLRRIADIDAPALDDTDLKSLANAVAQTFPPRIRLRQLLIDVTGLSETDACIFLKQIIISPPTGFRVEPVLFTESNSCRYARNMTLNCLDCPAGLVNDDPIEFFVGDILICLTPQQRVTATQEEFYQVVRNHGVSVEVVNFESACVAAVTLREIVTKLSFA